MRALVKTKSGVGNVEIAEVTEPVCTAKDVKVEVKFTGICGTDIHVFEDTFRNYPPVILGHEFSGVITEVGSEVKAKKIGDQVTVLPAAAVVCGKCEYCQQGYYMFCSVRRGMGHGTHGSFTKYAVVKEENAYRIPPEVSIEEAALAEPFAAAVQAIEELTTFNIGDTVLISGPGPIGLFCLLLLVRRGCRVIVAGTQLDSMRLALAKRLGAVATVDVTRNDLHEAVDQETEGRGVDCAVEAAGAPASVANCLEVVKPMGKYIQVGIVGKPFEVNFDRLLYKQIRLFGSVGHSRRTWQRVMSILAHRTIDLKPLISHKLPLSDWREGFDLCRKKQGMKVLIYYDTNGGKREAGA